MKCSSFIAGGALALALSLALSLSACTWETNLPDDAAAIHVEYSRELLITDDAVLGRLSNNTADGPLSFRRVMSRLPMKGTPADATLAWMRGWSERLRHEGTAARADTFDGAILEPWFRRSPSHVLRLEDAPFRLIAVANRTDLSVMPDRAAEGGEGRLVFALTDGPADASESRALPFTVIVEYAQRGPAREWATRWHELGALPDDAFPAKLAELAGAFVEQGSLAQLRTADAVTGPLVLHEFHLDAGELVPTNVRNTPNWASVAEGDVRAFAAERADAIEDGTYVLPAAWLASSSALHAEPPPYLASIREHDALRRGTCGGCHEQAENGFQIDPTATGDRRLSRFLLDPSKELDELGRRATWQKLTLSKK